MYMKKELCIRQIYEDFTNKIFLSDIEKEVLVRYIKNESIVHIASETMQSTSSVSRIIQKLKEKYYDYKTLEIAKLKVLNDK